MRPFALSATDTKNRQRIALYITGAVQGVGFRPFAYRLAVEEGLAGSVRNTGAGVSLEVEGGKKAIARFVTRLETECRPPATINRLERQELIQTDETGFRIEVSDTYGDPSALVLPDLAPCKECLTEVFDVTNRRYRYPFTTCMHCGPRYSVIETVPYDRERTVMKHFPMCRTCLAEYQSPTSRRFHAETNACPDCGPKLALLDPQARNVACGQEALKMTVEAIRQGCIVALKGLGGFQLLADARSDKAVALLRQRKHRPAKPFAIMAGSLDEIHTIAHAYGQEEELLRSPAAPIVLLPVRTDAAAPLAPNVAPNNLMIGVMLPSTPLHHLLVADLRFPVVATSGNRSGEPLAANDEEALTRLSSIADLFLTHDRPILNPIDDSVTTVIAAQKTVIRSARGYSPLVVTDRQQTLPVLALGGQAKNSVAIGNDGRIILGAHVGNLANADTRAAFARSAKTMTRLHGIEPEIIACDTHSGYHSTQAAGIMGLPVSKAPHHLAHVLGAMVDNGIEGPVLGVAWDGTGHGSDGTIWGGEFLEVNGSAWRRIGHLVPFRLPGGDRAVREPRRSAIGMLHALVGDALWKMEDLQPIAQFTSEERKILRAMLARHLNSPLTSSVGRLFDGMAAILDLCQRSSFESEAAMAVEFAANRATRNCQLPPPAILEGDGSIQLDWRLMLQTMIGSGQLGANSEELAAGFHDWLAKSIVAVAKLAGIEQVVLTGGCFQNALLTGRAVEYLEEAGFRSFRHGRVPPNDGGLSVGQVAFAARKPMREIG